MEIKSDVKYTKYYTESIQLLDSILLSISKKNESNTKPQKPSEPISQGSTPESIAPTSLKSGLEPKSSIKSGPSGPISPLKPNSIPEPSSQPTIESSPESNVESSSTHLDGHAESFGELCYFLYKSKIPNELTKKLSQVYSIFHPESKSLGN